ncbi:hypothetical protein TOT_030000151 [Theileria orientalis strain Shintoku]|uniref:Uncharacterized protein n=1 Tax=Theileria orientalis strain Shintoku TaxID=869250 RepID=J4D8N7_THEOR|nr:hypothetical protein TOT_030000151 [Theileria orientalis strain Shintoku]PVC53424.1 hypothetical protein MACL_00000084 [Theileria orientalis]BAM40890.1 hypothetical protein TOT_030000151 [Theileria orientalis strain Shintoku]|eukprot:XP_009691191.1 hypothetical protein TOT_030000151 [Theileria orientalis strain Shintoku]
MKAFDGLSIRRYRFLRNKCKVSYKVDLCRNVQLVKVDTYCGDYWVRK